MLNKTNQTKWMFSNRIQHFSSADKQACFFGWTTNGWRASRKRRQYWHWRILSTSAILFTRWRQIGGNSFVILVWPAIEWRNKENSHRNYSTDCGRTSRKTTTDHRRSCRPIHGNPTIEIRLKTDCFHYNSNTTKQNIIVIEARLFTLYIYKLLLWFSQNCE